MMPLPNLLAAAALFCLGLYGVLSRKSAVAILLSLELMVNASNLIFITLAHVSGGSSGQIFALFAMAITVAEVVIGMAIVVVMHRSKQSTDVDNLRELKR